MSHLEIQLRHRDPSGFELSVDTAIPLTGVTALFGPSGSGKTTLLDTIAGLRADVESAQVRFGDESWQGRERRLPADRRGIGYVFQDARLFPHLDVAGNLEFARRRAARPILRLEQVVEWLNMGVLLDRPTDTLSAGQQQRVAIARALLRGPRLLLLDEPLANLDRPAAAECLRGLSRVARETKLPMIYVSHQIEEICNIADHLLLMEHGQITAEGALLDLAGRLDSHLADDEHAAAILRVEPGALDKQYGLVELRVDGASLWVSATDMRGEERRLRIPARDVSICLEPPAASSILNILPVTVVEMRDSGAAHSLLRLRLAEQHLLARITRRSRDDLNLRVGNAVYAQIKSSALLGDSES